MLCPPNMVAAQHPNATLLELPRLRAEPSTVSPEAAAEAENLYQQVLVQAKNKKGTEAMRLAIEALRLNPDHAAIRNALGFQLVDEQGLDKKWRTAWEMQQQAEGKIDHPQFGWLPADHVARYEAGERWIPNRGWVAAEEDARFHQKLSAGWDIATEHYDIRTNHSLEEGVKLGRQLEHLYQACQLLFYPVFSTDAALAEMLTDPPKSDSSKKTVKPAKTPRHSVFVYRNKSDYVASLRGLDPAIAHSNGYYHAQGRRACFFVASADGDDFDQDAVAKTLFHEGTHQLLQESRPRRNTPGEWANYWLVEGITMFMETLDIQEDRYVLGDFYANRLYAAKVHYFEDHFYESFAVLTMQGQAAFRAHPMLRRLYSQLGGMTHFLMQVDGGKYRKATLELLRLIYAGTDRPDSLFRLTEKKATDLDAEYLEFLKAVPD